MPLKVLTPPTGPTGPLAAPVIQNLAATFDTVNRRVLLSFVQPSILASGILVEYKTATDEAETSATHPSLYQRLTKRPLSPANTTAVMTWVHELETYTIRMCTVDSFGNRSAYATTTVTTPQFAPQNHLSLWSEDCTQTPIWVADGGVAISTASGGGQLVNLGANDRAVEQRVPVDPIAGKTYVARYLVRAAVAGDVGKTITVILHSASEGAYNNKVITLAATDQEILHEITFGNGATGRYLNIGINTYNAMTATRAIVTRMQLSAGTAAAIPAYEKTSCPGTTWGQALLMQPGTWWYAQASTGYSGWHRSMVNDIHCIQMGNNTPGTLNLQGCRTVSKSGDHIHVEYAGNYRIIVNNHRARGVHPKADGKMRGRFFSGDFLWRLQVTNSWADHTGGVNTQGFQGEGGTDTVTFTSNKIIDTDGRRCTAAGSYIKSPYSDLGNPPPNGAPVGYNAVANIGLHGLTNSTRQLDGMEIAYNEFYARPGFSRVEDAYNMSGFGGTAASPIRVHHNLITRWPWDYKFFDNLGAGRTYSMGPIGDSGDLYYDTNTYDSGTSGMPVDSNLHEWDFSKNGKNILVYANTILWAACVTGLLDGRNVVIRNNIHVSSGNLPDSSTQVRGVGKLAGYQITRYPQSSVTATAAAGAAATSVTVSSDAANGFLGSWAYRSGTFSNGVQVMFQYNGGGVTATSANIYNVGGNVPVGSTMVIGYGMSYATLTLTGTALTSASTSMTFTLSITSGFKAGGYIVFANGVTVQITADQPFAAANTLTVSALSRAVPINTTGQYYDGYFASNAVAENLLRTLSANPFANLKTDGSTPLSPLTSRDNQILGASSSADEWAAYDDWQTLLTSWNRTPGPLIA